MRHKKINITKSKLMWLIAISFFCILALLGTAESKKADLKKEDSITTQSADENSQESINSETEAQGQGIFSREYTEDEFGPRSAGGSYIWSFIKMLFILGVMVAMFYYFFRYVSKKTGANISSADISTTLSIIPIAQNKFLQIVDLGGKILVLGVSDNSINLITEITEKHEVDKIRVLNLNNSQIQSSQGSFSDFLRKQVGHILDRVSNKNETRFENDYGFEHKVDIEYLKKQRSRLKKLNGASNE